MAGIWDTGIWDTGIWDSGASLSVLPTRTPIDMSKQVRVLLIQQGESLPFEFDLDGDRTAGWTCTINVRAYPQDSVLLTRVIPESGYNSWIGYLTSTETAAFPTGTYRLTGVLTNSTTDEKALPPVRFTVSQAWG